MKRNRLAPVVLGAVLTLLAVLVPAAPAAAATGQVQFYNNCGSLAQVLAYKPSSGVAQSGAQVPAGATRVLTLDASINWRFVMPKGTRYYTPSPYYLGTFTLC